MGMESRISKTLTKDLTGDKVKRFDDEKEGTIESIYYNGHKFTMRIKYSDGIRETDLDDAGLYVSVSNKS